MANGAGPTPLSSKERIVLGALGAAVVGVATYPIAFDGYSDLFLEADVAMWLGFVLRVAGATFVGAIWGFVHRPEFDPQRAFQIGMVAPATIFGMIYANPGAPPAQDAAQIEPAVESSVADPSTLLVLASTGEGPRPTRIFTERLVRGLFGR